MRNKRDLLTVRDMTHEDIMVLMARATDLKREAKKNIYRTPLAGKTLGLLFEKSSTRTRVSFEVGMVQLGGGAIFLTPDAIQIQRGETIADTARVLSRYLDGLVIRTFEHSKVEEWGRAADIPVINGLTDLHHPCQALSDLLTIQERFGTFRGLTLAYIGDGNNVANSLMEACALVGIEMRLACPKGFEPDREIYAWARKQASHIGTRVEIAKDPTAAARDADILYTDVWVSMGQEKESKARAKLFKPYQINAGIVALAKKHVAVMHCLPAHRGEEITGDVLDGSHAVVLDQAENRLHTQKALLESLLVAGPAQ